MSNAGILPKCLLILGCDFGIRGCPLLWHPPPQYPAASQLFSIWCHFNCILWFLNNTTQMCYLWTLFWSGFLRVDRLLSFHTGSFPPGAYWTQSDQLHYCLQSRWVFELLAVRSHHMNEAIVMSTFVLLFCGFRSSSVQPTSQAVNQRIEMNRSYAATNQEWQKEFLL